MTCWNYIACHNKMSLLEFMLIYKSVHKWSVIVWGKFRTLSFCFPCIFCHPLDFPCLTCRVRCSSWPRAAEGVWESRLSLCSGKTTAQALEGCCCHTQMHFVFTTSGIFSTFVASWFQYRRLARHLSFFSSFPPLMSFPFLRRDTVSEKCRRR